ncbi:MAG: TrmB family transcriptional regulator [Candidatus Nanoarchaeia archaeon]
MIDKLKQLGLTDGEAKVYFALLKKGPSTVGPIVKNSGVAYSNIYEILERLEKKGLVSYVTKQKTKHFQAANPESLSAYLENKKSELKEKELVLNSIFPIISSMSKDAQQDAEIFSGKKGLRTAYQIMLDSRKPGDEFLFFVKFPEELKEDISEFYIVLGRKFQKNKILLKGIAHESYRNYPGVKETSAFTHLKYVDFPTLSSMDICGDKVMFITWQNLTGYLITSKELSNNLKEYFHDVWKKAKK